MVGADLREAVLANVTARGLDLTEARLDGASFSGADLREARLRGVEGYRTATWIGTDVRNVDFCGAMLMRRHVLDENFLHEFRNQSTASEWVYKLWWVTSDCGRSIARWASWTALVAVLYGGLYMFVELD